MDEYACVAYSAHIRLIQYTCALCICIHYSHICMYIFVFVCMYYVYVDVYVNVYIYMELYIHVYIVK